MPALITTVRSGAQSVYDSDPTRYAALDPDSNGLACEDLPLGVAPAGWTNEVPRGAEQAALISLSDGDTIRVDVGGREETLRLIDTPETRDPNNPPECYGLWSECETNAKGDTNELGGSETESTPGEQPPLTPAPEQKQVFDPDGASLAVTLPIPTSASHHRRQTSTAATSMTRASGTSRSYRPIRITWTATVMGWPVRVASWAYVCWRMDVRPHPPRVHGYEGEGVILRFTADNVE